MGDPETVTRQIIEQRAACGNPDVLAVKGDAVHLVGGAGDEGGYAGAY